MSEPHDFRSTRRKKAELRIDQDEPREIPHSLEAERGVLGCLLLSPQDCLSDCQTAFRLAGSDVFYDLRHRMIYEVFCELVERERGADLITVQECLRKRNQLDCVGGVVYLASLPDAVPSAANLLYYVDIVVEKHILRSTIGFMTEAVARCYAHTGDIAETMDELERDFLQIGELTQGMAGERTMHDVAGAHEAALEQGWRDRFTGLSTGFTELDDLLLGLKPGQVLTIAGGTSDGKSSLAGNILRRNLQDGIPCGLFTLEMDAEEMFGRFASDLSNVPLVTAQKGMVEEDMMLYANASKAVRKWPLQICDESNITVSQIRSRLRRWATKGVQLVIIDYTQLVQSGLDSRKGRTEQVSHVTATIKAMARELKVAVIQLSQLSRDHKKLNRPPRNDDLRESGSIEQDSDKIILLWRANQNDSPEARLMKLNVSKHRNGPTGAIELNFNMPRFRFETIADNH